MQKIEEKVRKYLAEIMEDESLMMVDVNQELGIDSISFVRVVIELEEEFNFEFNEFDLNIQSFQKISDFVKYVEDQIK